MELIRVLTLNTHKGFSSLNSKFILHELREAIRNVSADLVFLQEILGENTKHSQEVENWPDVPQYEFLADSLWPDFAYGKNATYSEGHHGNAILSKFAIRTSQNQSLTTYPLEQRGMLHCEIQIGNHPDLNLHAVCVHLGLFSTHRKQQLRMICDFISENVPAKAPLIVAGDFNDWLHTGDSLFRSQLSLRETHYSRHGKFAKTFPAFFPFLALDRIYIRGFHVKESRVVEEKMLSDHSGLLAEILLETP
jgi:endonuclease/exonuclease/phosphatase family metal-dependent hydrolase